MNYDIISAIAANNSENLIYVSDIDTYEIHYVNKKIANLLGVEDPEELVGKLCYEVLQGNGAPCKFCTNHLLSEKPYFWRHHNPIIEKWFELMDKIIVVEGKPLRLEIASDITSLMNTERELTHRLAEEAALFDAIETLYSESDEKIAFETLLNICREFYDADRAYIFKIIYEKRVVNNIYEVCAKDVPAQIDLCKDIPLDFFKLWLEEYDTGELSVLNINTQDINHVPNLLSHFENQKTNTVSTIPIMGENGIITGFVGMDNAKKNNDGDSLLKSIAKLIVTHMDKLSLLSRMETLNYIDQLTDAKNRQGFSAALEKMTMDYQESVGVVCTDMNGLKEINQDKGTEYGNRLLICLTQILKRCFGEAVFRVGGDEFVAVALGINEEQFKSRVADFFNDVNKVRDLKVAVGYNWKTNTYNLAEFIEKTDNLRYVNKELLYQKTGNRKKHNTVLAKSIIEEIELGRYVVYLQPQYDLKSGEIMGAEALIRKFAPEGNPIFPNDFIPFYEKEGVIDLIDLFVMEQVCRYMAECRKRNPELNMPVSVNLSRVTLSNMDIVNRMTDACIKYDVPMGCINVEVTETIKEDEGMVMVMLDKLAEEGFGISLDDFGVGQSNFTILTEMNFTEVKLDRSLVEKITFDKQSYTLIKHFVALCKDLCIPHIVAEGIETLEQFKLLSELGCDLGQGYYLARPMPIEDFIAMVNDL